MILTGYGPTVVMDAVPGYTEIGCNMAATEFMNTLRDEFLMVPYAYCIRGPEKEE